MWSWTWLEIKTVSEKTQPTIQPSPRTNRPPFSTTGTYVRQAPLPLVSLSTPHPLSILLLPLLALCVCAVESWSLSFSFIYNDGALIGLLLLLLLYLLLLLLKLLFLHVAPLLSSSWSSSAVVRCWPSSWRTIFSSSQLLRYYYLYHLILLLSLFILCI